MIYTKCFQGILSSFILIINNVFKVETLPFWVGSFVLERDAPTCYG